jgi:predicted nucleic acid-binding protein
MILVDSSAWIEFYRPSGSPGVRTVVAAAIESDLVAVNGVIQVEVLAFSRHDNRRKLASHFEALHWLDLGKSSFDLATEIGARARSEGITVPSTDLIIAACAVESGSVLLHADTHFDLLIPHSGLKSRNLLVQN